MVDQDRWDAVKRKDKAADGAFVYAVRTTGVYCRPSCGARLPRPENVRFFISGADAESAGFRPCKRCKPGQQAAVNAHVNTIRQACDLAARSETKPDWNAIAAGAGLSRFHFHRIFKSVTGLTPGAWLKAHRRAKVIDALGQSRSVTDAIYDAGYSSSSRFYANAAPHLGMHPAAYIRKGRGETIRFAVGECSLGAIIVAATDRGICAIQFGEDPGTLLDTLQEMFPQAELIGGDDKFETYVALVVGAVEEPGAAPDLPLDIRGTAFQQKVWDALRKIPSGKTMTYTEIAEQIGAPASVRAVAKACASNRLAIAIPCHRVVRKDGGLAGFRWGVDRKAALLRKESDAI